MLQRIWHWLLRTIFRTNPKQSRARGEQPKDIYPLW